MSSTVPPESWNPDVTVRARGVMEKCTYCIQRIAEARIVADRESRPVGEVRTACQAACPTQAFTFGNLADPQSAVSKRKQSPLDFAMLEEQNTKPRTTYEALVRNPNPAIKADVRMSDIPASRFAGIEAAPTSASPRRAAPPRRSGDFSQCYHGLDDRPHLRDHSARAGLPLVVDRLYSVHGADAAPGGLDRYLFYAGIGIWGVSWPVAWGFAILSYVWWIAIASGGTIISALFFLMRVEWRTSINRIAESMMLFGAAAAGVYPDPASRAALVRLLAVFLSEHDDTVGRSSAVRCCGISGRSTPTSWPPCCFGISALLPDLATVRDRATSRAKQMIYGLLACGFRGSSRQWQHLHATYGVMAAIMAPVVVSIHSIVGLDFAGGATVGWHSTEFPPFFVFGALLSGFAIVLLLIIPLRRLLRLEDMITGRHFDVLCKLLLTSSLCMAYAYIMDVFTTYYGGDRAERVMFTERMFGYYMAGLLGDDPVQRLAAATALVPAVAA